MELDDVLSTMKRARSEGVNRQSNDFYNACLERINQLTTERNSKVGKTELIKVLREVSYYRPKE
jgi:DNA replication initiation complex subunit (GINS family)